MDALEFLSPSRWHPLALTFSALTLYLLYQYFLHPLRLYPGPLLAKFTNYWRFQNVRTRKSHLSRVALHKRYGPVVRVGPNTLSIADPAYIPKIYGPGLGFIKSPFYHPFQGWVGDKIGYNLFTTRDPAYHSALKKPVAAAYSFYAAVEYEPIVDECIEAIVRYLDQHVVASVRDKEKGETRKTAWDIAGWMQYYSFDVMAMMTWGKPFGFLERGQDVNNMIKRLDARLDVISPQSQMPWLDWVFAKNPLVNLFRDRTNAFAALAAKLIQDRQQHLASSSSSSPSPPPSSLTADPKKSTATHQQRLFIDHFLAAQETHPSTVDARTVTIYATTNIMAGSDTVAIALRTIFYMLLRHPDVYARLQAEIDGAFLGGDDHHHHHTPTNTPTTKSSAVDQDGHQQKQRTPFPIPFTLASTSLPYLSAVVQESLRIHPPVGLPLERIVPAAGLHMHDGQTLPPGVQVACHAWPLHLLNPAIWGPEPESFRPERWLRGGGGGGTGPETEKEYTARIQAMKNASLAFGAGSRICMGRHLSMVQILKLVPSLLVRYRFALVDGDKEWKVVCGWFVRQAEMDVFVERRREWLDGRDGGEGIGGA